MDNKNELYEIIFDGLSGVVAKALSETIANKSILLPDNETALFMTVLPRLSIHKGIFINNVQLRLFRYENNAYDVELNFIERDIISPDFLGISKVIHEYCKALAQQYSIENYYGGLDPATDSDTRIFTRDSLGPMSIFGQM